MFKQITKELKNHAPFTFFGALTGIVIIAFFQKLLAKSAKLGTRSCMC